MQKIKGKAVAIVSGGLDSTTLLYDQRQNYDIVQALSFNYGQRHKKELDYALASCERILIPWTLIDLWSSGLTDLLSISGSSLVSGTEVPEGHYGEDSMKATVVPNRNLMMLSIAGAVAVAMGADRILTGVHAGDHFIYPDCRPEFISYASLAIANGNEGFSNLKFDCIDAPYMHATKADIAFNAISHRLPFHRTWSCYKGGRNHCGKCGTCVERLEAIAEASKRWYELEGEVIVDETVYDDTSFWREAIKRETV